MLPGGMGRFGPGRGAGQGAVAQTMTGMCLGACRSLTPRAHPHARTHAPSTTIARQNSSGIAPYTLANSCTLPQQDHILIWDCGGSNAAEILAAGRARGNDRSKEVQIEEAASRTHGFGRSMVRKLLLGRGGGKAHLVEFSPDGQHLAVVVRRSHKHRRSGELMTPAEMQLTGSTSGCDAGKTRYVAHGYIHTTRASLVPLARVALYLQRPTLTSKLRIASACRRRLPTTRIAPGTHTSRNCYPCVALGCRAQAAPTDPPIRRMDC